MEPSKIRPQRHLKEIVFLYFMPSTFFRQKAESIFKVQNWNRNHSLKSQTWFSKCFFLFFGLILLTPKWSKQCDQLARLFFNLWPFTKKENFSGSNYIFFAKEGLKSFKIQNKPSNFSKEINFCQSGEISPHLVTLSHSYISCPYGWLISIRLVSATLLLLPMSRKDTLQALVSGGFKI